MGRTLPTECPHGYVLDWGDFGPDELDGSVGARSCRECGVAVEFDEATQELATELTEERTLHNATRAQLADARRQLDLQVRGCISSRRSLCEQSDRYLAELAQARAAVDAVARVERLTSRMEHYPLGTAARAAGDEFRRALDGS